MDERETFESWAYKEFAFGDGDDIDVCARDKSGYQYANVDSAWRAWQVRAALEKASNCAASDTAIALLSDDAYAITFQTMGQYRTAILKALKEMS